MKTIAEQDNRQVYNIIDKQLDLASNDDMICDISLKKISVRIASINMNGESNIFDTVFVYEKRSDFLIFENEQEVSTFLVEVFKDL